MAAEESRELLIGLESVREQLGPIHFWGLIVGAFAFLLDLVLLAALALNWLTKRFQRHELEPARWSLIDPVWIWLINFGLGYCVAVVLGGESFQYWGFHVQIGLNAICCLLVLQVPVSLYRQSVTSLGVIGLSRLRDLGQGVVAYFAFLPAAIGVHFSWLLVLLLAGVEFPGQVVVERCREAFETGDVVLAGGIVFLALVAAPIFEELLFRGLVYRALREKLSVTGAAVVSGVLFAIIHMSLLAFVPVAVLGIALAFVFERTGSIWSCIAMHAMFNAGTLALLLAGIST